MSVFNLADYDISAERGFLSSFDPDKTELPSELQPARDLAMALPRMLVSGQPRKYIEALPFADLTDFCATATLAQRRIAMVHYSFLVQAYVWGEPQPPKALPKCLALPIWQLGASIGQPPLLTYSSYVLDRKSTRLNSSHVRISYAVFCLKKKNQNNQQMTLRLAALLDDIKKTLAAVIRVKTVYSRTTIVAHILLMFRTYVLAGALLVLAV